ncbi:MAG: type II toxin-antitoxin system YafQ family toxin [Bacteroidales bacterium]|nr:type II toxin-antitoxin system YafQ family toxin [Bacteroidales bacterium]
MAKFSLHLSKRYLKDLKLARRRGLDEVSLNEIVKKLLDGEELPVKNRNHQLHGQYEGCWECHINPDWLLIYIKDTEIRIVSLQRTGTHSDLFGKNRK